MFSHEEILAAIGPPNEETGSKYLTASIEEKRATSGLYAADEVSSLLPQYPLLKTLEIRRTGYDVTIFDLWNSHSSARAPPIVRAAGKPNLSVLKATLLLSEPRYGPSSCWDGTSPLREAVEADLPENVSFLLAHGVDPNGCELTHLSDYSARFLRFRPKLDVAKYRREIVLAGISIPQDAALTEKEIDARRLYVAKFWAEVEPPLDVGSYYSYKELLALELAAGTGNTSLIDMLLAAGADTGAWLRSYKYDEMPSEPTPSFLAPSTPLHQAIEKGDLPMIEHLLRRGFATDVFPLAAITHTLNPVMATLATNPPSLDAYKLLAPHADLSLRNPIFKIHILHIAVATLALPVITRVAADVPLSSAGLTALQHSLLHIACLPADESHINRFSEAVYNSNHDLRSLSTAGSVEKYRHASPRPPSSPYRPKAPVVPPARESFAAQTEVLGYLLASGTQDVAATDIHGNTALHYLASYARPVNQEAIALLKGAGSTAGAGAGVVVWETTKNHWGATPKDLFDSNMLAAAAATATAADNDGDEAEVWMPFWRRSIPSWQSEAENRYWPRRARGGGRGRGRGQS